MSSSALYESEWWASRSVRFTPRARDTFHLEGGRANSRSGYSKSQKSCPRLFSNQDSSDIQPVAHDYFILYKS